MDFRLRSSITRYLIDWNDFANITYFPIVGIAYVKKCLVINDDFCFLLMLQ